MRKILSALDAPPRTRFSTRPLKFLALTAENRRNFMSIKHFLLPASYSAVSPPSLAAGL
jgi:hypothetical protein